MNRTICELLKNHIIDLGFDWTDKVFGMVEPLTQNIKSADGVIQKTMPVYRNTNQVNCSKPSTYEYAVPETRIKSLIYFEAETANQLTETERFVEYSLPINLVCWGNLKKINVSYETARPLFAMLYGNMPKTLANTNPMYAIRVSIKEFGRDLGMFTKYDFNEVEHQMLIYPFDFFSLRLEVVFRVSKSCVNNVTLNPSSCNTF